MSEELKSSPEEQVQQKFQSLFRDGKLVQIHISKWHGKTALQAADLPLKEDAAVPGYADLGRKHLIDMERLRQFTSLESTARTYLDNNSHLFPIASAHFVPSRTILPVVKKLRELQGKYLALAGTFATNYPTYREEHLTKYAAQRELLEPYYPTPEAVRGAFQFDIVMFEVSIPRRMKEVTLEKLQAQADAKDALQAEFEQHLAEQHQHNERLIGEFFRKVVVDTRGKVVEVFRHISEKIRTGEVVSPKNVKTMRNIIGAFQGLDFMDDKEVRTRLDEVSRLLEAGSDFKEDHVALTALNDSITDVLRVAESLSDVDAVTGDYVRRLQL